MKYFLFLAIPLFILDQLTKGWILKRFPDGPSPLNPIEVIPDFFWITRVHNTGMAFGIGNGNPYSNYIFGAIGIVALTVIVIMWRKNAFPDPLSKTAVALLISGILGNQFDRALPGRGYVVDFLDFKLPLYGHFPVFNVADSCICIAAGIMIISAFKGMWEEYQEKKAAETAGGSKES